MTRPTYAIPGRQPLNELLSLRGRVAVVTGGSRGIGEAIALRLVEAGAAVVVTGRSREALNRLESYGSEAGGNVVGVRADASNTADAHKVIGAAVERFGRLDILVNNAAVFARCLAEEMTEQLWVETLDTDLKGAFFTAQAAAAAMVAGARGGRIVNLLSLEGFQPTGVLVAYGAAKAGLNAVTKSLAIEYAEHQILVNAVVPGATMTAERIQALRSGQFTDSQLAPNAPKTREKMQQMLSGLGGPAQMMGRMPLGRPGIPDDIATAVLFLASDMAGYISGACLNVDGAQSLR